MLVRLNRDALNIDARRRQVFVVKSFLSFVETSRLFLHDACKSMLRLMQMNLSDSSLARIPFKVFDKSV